METIKFKTDKDRDKAFEILFGHQIIKIISENTFGVSTGTADKLKESNNGIQFEVLDRSRRPVFVH